MTNVTIEVAACAGTDRPQELPAEHMRGRLEATYRSVREDLGEEIRQQLKPFVGYPADVEHPSMCRRSMPLTASSKTKKATSR